jgi:beta-galactosidase beta subunit
MSTTLTRDDLNSIGQLIDEKVGNIVESKVGDLIETRVRPIIEQVVEDAIEDSKRHTAAGFAEVHEKIANVQATVDRIERVQIAEIERVDKHEIAIQKVRKALRAL